MNKLSPEVKKIKKLWITLQITTSLFFLLLFVIIQLNIGKIYIPILTYQDYLNIGLILPVLEAFRSMTIYVVAYFFITVGLVFLYDLEERWVFKLNEYMTYLNITFFTTFTVAGIFFSRAFFNPSRGAIIPNLNTFVVIFDIFILIFGFTMIYSNILTLKQIFILFNKRKNDILTSSINKEKENK